MILKCCCLGLQQALDLVKEIIDKSKSKENKWSKRVTRATTEWFKAHVNLKKFILSKEIPSSKLCLNCHQNEACIRCYDCIPSFEICSDCDVLLHQFMPFHNRSSFNGEFYESMTPGESFSDDGYVAVGN